MPAVPAWLALGLRPGMPPLQWPAPQPLQQPPPQTAMLPCLQHTPALGGQCSRFLCTFRCSSHRLNQPCRHVLGAHLCSGGNLTGFTAHAAVTTTPDSHAAMSMAHTCACTGKEAGSIESPSCTSPPIGHLNIVVMHHDHDQALHLPPLHGIKSVEGAMYGCAST
eukprot:scaffold92913_cov20-Tisochrysis_lutea.AAC.1